MKNNMKKLSSTLVLLLLGIATSLAQTWTPTYPVNIDATNFSDDVFRQWVSDNVDVNHDGQLDYEEVEAITIIKFEPLSFEAQNITNLQGIEYFEELKSLYCYGEKKGSIWRLSSLKTADLSKNKKLTNINVEYACLETLILPESVKELSCLYNSNLTTLDITQCPSLKILFANNCSLSEIDLSHSPLLTGLALYNNKLTALDVTKNVQLQVLACHYNQITALDVTQNTQLVSLNCQSNKISTLDVAQNTLLTSLLCKSNKISALDVTNNTLLRNLKCDYNQISSLDVSQNPNLVELTCDNNKISSLDVSQNPLLEILTCNFNQLNSLDVSQNPKLVRLECHSNQQMTALNVTPTPNLQTLRCNSCQLTTLNVAQFPELTSLSCYENQISSLDITQNPKLTSLNAHSNNLSSLDLSNNTKLKDLLVSNNNIPSLDCHYCPLLEDLRCANNGMFVLNISTCAQLKWLYINDNNFTELPPFPSTKLTVLECQNNALTALDVSHLPLLERLTITGQQKVVAIDVVGSEHEFLGTSEISSGWNPEFMSNVTFRYKGKSEGISAQQVEQNGKQFLLLKACNDQKDVDMLNFNPSTSASNRASYHYNVPLHENVDVNSRMIQTIMSVSLDFLPFFAMYIHPVTKDNNRDDVYTGTLYLPDNAVLRDDENAKMYYVTGIDTQSEAEGRAQLTPVNSLIPMQSGVIVTNTVPHYTIFRSLLNFRTNNRKILEAFAYGAPWPLMGNLMEGTADEAGKTVEWGSVLTLGRRTDDKSNLMGFWNFSGTKINQYRAYIPISVITQAGLTRAAGVAFDFSDIDENVTVINAAEHSMVNVQRSIVFDLQGRRVANPQKGGVYIVNGKKVMM